MLRPCVHRNDAPSMNEDVSVLQVSGILGIKSESMIESGVHVDTSQLSRVLGITYEADVEILAPARARGCLNTVL
jgi:hypothetical protein